MSIYYSNGTISVVSGSAIVTGTSTSWQGYIQPGDNITIGGISYSILSVNSDFSLTLTSVFSGSSGSGISYVAALGWISSVFNLAALRNVAGPSAAIGIASGRTQISVACYSGAGDNGGGIFYWDPSSAVSDNSGTVINPTGHSGNGRWLRILPNGGYVTPAMFGAVVNSSSADNAAAFTAAISSGHTSIRVDEGVYNFKTPITISATTPNLTIEGLGYVVLNADDTGSGIPSHSLVTIQANGITLRNLNLTGTQYQGYGINVPAVDNLLRILSNTTEGRLSDILLENLTFIGGQNGISVNRVDEITLLNVNISYAYGFSCAISDCTNEIIKGYRARYGGTNEGLKFGYDLSVPGQNIIGQNIIIDDFIIEYCGRINPDSSQWQEGMDLFVGAIARVKVTNGIVRGCGGGFELKHSSSPAVGQAIFITAPFSSGQTFAATVNGTPISPVTFTTTNLAMCNTIVSEINSLLGTTAATLISYATAPQILVQSGGISVTSVSVSGGAYANSAVVETLDEASEIDFSNITVHNDTPSSNGFNIHWASGGTTPTPSSCNRVSLSNISLFYEGPAETDSHSSSVGILISGWTEVQIDGGRIHGFNAAVLLSSATTGATFAPDLRIRIRNVSVRDGNHGIWSSGSAGAAADIDTLLLQDNDFEVPYPVDLHQATTTNVEIRGGRYVSAPDDPSFLGVQIQGSTNFLMEDAYISGGSYAFRCLAPTGSAPHSTGLIRRSTLISQNVQPARFDDGTWQYYDNELTTAGANYAGWLGSATVIAANNNLGLRVPANMSPSPAGNIGDVVLNSAPTAGGVFKWVCTTAGSSSSAVWKGVAILP